VRDTRYEGRSLMREPITLATVPGNALGQLLLDAVKFTSKDEARPVLRAVSLEAFTGRLVVAATDSYRMLLVTMDVEDVAEGWPAGQVMLDRADATALGKRLVSEGPAPVRLVYRPDLHVLEGHQEDDSRTPVWFSGCVTGEFVNWRRLVGARDELAGRLALDEGEMAKVFAKARRLRSEMVRFDVSGEEVVVRYQGKPKGAQEEEHVEAVLPLAIWYPSAQSEAWFCVNTAFLSSMLAALPGALLEVPVFSSGRPKPLRMTVEGRTAMVMPIMPPDGVREYQPRVRAKGVRRAVSS